MEFHCTTCGHKLTVPDTQIGKHGRCPRCREVLTVPGPDTKPDRVPLDGRLLDLPEPEPTAEDQTETSYEELRAAFGGRIQEPEEIPERKYPWMLDILLYPLNVSALTILAICVGGPFCLRLALVFCKVLTGAIGVLLIFWVLFLMLHWGVLLLLVMYMVWYFCQCIRDSAEGQIRAAQTTASTPGLAELLGQTLKLLICALVCLVPTIVYRADTHSPNHVLWILTGAGNFLLPAAMPIEVIRRIADAPDPIPAFGSIQGIEPMFWILWGVGNFLFPMVLLAMVMHDRFFVALNPILIVRSIFRTFFPYCALALACCVLSLSLSSIYHLILSPQYWHWAYVLLALAFYQMLIMAHLLGRFHFKNDEKLYWDT
jgi:hypothetical protein